MLNFKLIAVQLALLVLDLVLMHGGPPLAAPPINYYHNYNKIIHNPDYTLFTGKAGTGVCCW